MPLTPSQIEDARQTIMTVERADETMVWLDEAAKEQGDCLGERIRNVFGSSMLTQFTNRELGEMVIDAIIANIFRCRERLVSDYADVISFSIPPTQIITRYAKKDPSQ